MELAYVVNFDDVNKNLKTIAQMEAISGMDGTVKGYKDAMRKWFLASGVNAVSSVGLTALVNEWYAQTRDTWDGATVFAQPDKDADGKSTGTRIRDNVGMVCEPSTDLVAGQDDYAALPLFAVTLVNWSLDANGDILIDQIAGITDGYKQNDPLKYVGCMQMAGFTYRYEDADTYTIGYTANRGAGHTNLTPLPESIKTDGKLREFVVHSKYMSATVNGKMTCCSGQIPTANISHNSLITLSAANGSGYSGGTVIDWSFLVLMTMIKYASMTQDGVNQGCVNYNYSYKAAVSESNVKRVLITPAQAANLKVGSSVNIGATERSVSNPCGVITSIEEVEVSGATYAAVNVDLPEAISTTAGTTYISTWHWISGTNDNVLGNDGAKASPGDGAYPAMIQGIEYSVGGYEVFADVIINIENGSYRPYIARLRSHQATSITNNMIASDLLSAQPSSDAWTYIRRLKYDGEIFFGIDTNNGNSAKYSKDGFYKNGSDTQSGTREWLAFGGLGNGSGGGGLSFLFGAYALGSGFWYCLARLSCNGNRGDLAA